MDNFLLRDICDALVRTSTGSLRNNVAIVDGSRRVTYAELLDRARNTAALLTDRGLRKGDRVVIFLPRSFEAVVALFATWFAGGVAVIANEHLRTMQVRHIIDHSECALVLTNTRQILAVGRLPYARVMNIDQIDPPMDAYPAAPIIGADLALLIYTSGSTGLPKGVMLSHDNLLSGAEIVSSYLRLTERDVILSVLPFSFDYGLNQLLTAILVGATLVLQRSPFAPDICRALEREQITGLAGVPTLWLQLTGKQSPFLKAALPHLRYITNSGGRLPESTVKLIREAHPHTQIYLMYGLTEAFRSTYLPPDEVDRRPASMGKAIPNVEVLVLDDDGRRCAPGEVGELVHRGANVALGYWRDPEGTARVFRPNPLHDWRNGRHEAVVFSGDLVTLDPEGYLYFIGRKDKLIKSRGVRVSPEEIEACVHTSGLISHVVSFAVAEDGNEANVIVAVVPSDPHEFREEALEEFCKREMPEYMRPHRIWRLDAVPLTSSGKPDRGRIQQLYVEHRQSTGTAARAARTA
jgi:acyl-CoA ligase (AMP-forming) (exosortase A-associated)